MYQPTLGGGEMHNSEEGILAHGIYGPNISVRSL